MKKKFEYTETKGLPGGPNEYITHVSGMFSTEGYKRNSPDVNNPYNIIPSGSITMKGVDFPVMGTDNLGNSKAMIPGNNYQFPGDMVFETPMYKRGGGLLTKTMKCNNCSWEWKAADGGNDVTTCHKCGGEALPKAQDGNGEYIVKSGNTFDGIANKLGIDKQALREANPGIDYNKLKINQLIKLPTQVVQKPVQQPEETSKAVVKKEPFNNYTITPDLLYKQAYVESRLEPKAKNSLGYMGLGQIGEGVITDYKRATGVKEVDPYDPKQNHDVQEWSMNELYNASFIDKPGATAENRLIKALASYNYGRGKVKDILEAEKAKGNDIYKSNDWTKQLPKETREYIDMIVYNGKTEKRPNVQENYLNATTDDSYKDLRSIYKFQLKGEVNSKSAAVFDIPSYYGDLGRRFVQEQRIVAQDNTRVSIPAVNKELAFFNKIEKQDLSNFKYDVRPIEIARDNTNVVLPGRPELNTSSPEQLDIAGRQLERPNLARQFTEAVNEYTPKNKYEKDYANASSDEIKNLQRTLIKEGYGSLLGEFGEEGNGVDGKFGPKTKAAYNSLISDGNLGLNNIDKYYKKYSNNNKADVIKIQNTLVEQGYLPEKTKDGKSNIDGKFGDRTKLALQEYNSSTKDEDPNAFIFNNIPNKLEDPRCAAGMCSILEDNNIITEALGIKYKNAWDIHENMRNAGNSQSIYNIYDEPEFANLGPGTSAEELKSITKEVKQRSQTKESDYEVGDIVGLYWPNSQYHEETLKNSKTFNTHVGFVSDFDKNGKPIITHNVSGNVLQQPYDQLQTTWISRPEKNVKLNKKYDASEYQKIEVDENLISNFEAKKERPLTTNERDVVGNIMKRSRYNAQAIPEMLNSSVDRNWLEAATFAITGVESSAGISPNTPRTVEEAASQNYGLQGLAYTIKDKTSEDISLGVAKTKFNSLDNFAKEYFNINSPEDLANDNKATDAVSYLLVKHYELFKNYSQQYPELGLTDQDIKNMSILAHNQGTNMLLKTGRNLSGPGDNRSIEEQIESLRKLYQGKIKDVSSTKLKYLGDVGEFIYNLTKDEGDETYVSKSNRYIDEVYNKNKKQYVNVDSRKPKPSIMAKGGEYQVFSNYVNGMYDNTPNDKEAKKIYDKLNRVHYKDAKKAGTTVPNYILSVLMNTAND
jgi:murein DD-endopeptidase MepM/ murein hydrolase activator NlpD